MWAAFSATARQSCGEDVRGLLHPVEVQEHGVSRENDAATAASGAVLGTSSTLQNTAVFDRRGRVDGVAERGYVERKPGGTFASDVQRDRYNDLSVGGGNAGGANSGRQLCGSSDEIPFERRRR